MPGSGRPSEPHVDGDHRTVVRRGRDTDLQRLLGAGVDVVVVQVGVEDRPVAVEVVGDEHDCRPRVRRDERVGGDVGDNDTAIGRESVGHLGALHGTVLDIGVPAVAGRIPMPRTPRPAGAPSSAACRVMLSLAAPPAQQPRCFRPLTSVVYPGPTTSSAGRVSPAAADIQVPMD